MLAGLQTMWAQSYRVYKTDGTVVPFSCLKTDSIVFSDKTDFDVDFNPYMIANRYVVGTWYKSKTESVTFNEDDTTDYIEGGTYEFMPYQGTIIIYNASEAPVNIIRVHKVTAERLIVSTLGSSIISILSRTKPDSGSEPTEHEYVDLGLPSGTLWATCNIGANSPEEYGDYFAWGETELKNDYGWNNYKYSNGTSTTLTKYCTNSSYGTVDNKTELEPEDDAASANWGSSWKMPSTDQLTELFNDNYTITTWTTQNNVYGRLIKSKSSDKSIFLPAAGYYGGTNVGSEGYYLSRLLDKRGISFMACILYFDTSSISKDFAGSRSNGYTIRPVRVSGDTAPTLATSIVLSESSIKLKPNESKQLTATIKPDNATNKSITWSSSKTRVATIDNTGKVTAIADGTCIITCIAMDGSGVYAECQVTVSNTDEHVCVDLGLPSGTLWATCNIGANSPDEYGDYFAWGETQPKSNYSWSTYKWCNGTNTSLTKYCTKSEYGKVDGRTELLPEDDAATVNWGSEWHMPDFEQIVEIVDNTTTTWAKERGVYGYRLTSNINGNSIFLPAAGYRDGTNHCGDYYDLSNVAVYLANFISYGDEPDYAVGLFRSKENGVIGISVLLYERRCCGYTVRPVRVP